MNILVIEDNPVSRSAVRAALEAEGHRILEAADGKTGLELMAREKPDLVLEDLLLPDAEHVAQLRQAAGMTHSGLTLELTESALLADSDKTHAGFRRLRDMGVHFSIDDFGTGYSSLSYLNKLPVNEIKIDQSFISGLITDPDSAAIVRSTIDLGRNLGLTVVAEGVEDQNTWESLAALGCDAAQGYHMCRPIPAEELTPWMKESPWGVL